MAKQDEYVRYTIRVPADLYEKIQGMADENHRSVNAEIVARLDSTFVDPTAVDVKMLPGLKAAAEIGPASAAALQHLYEALVLELSRNQLNRKNVIIEELENSLHKPDVVIKTDKGVLLFEFKNTEKMSHDEVEKAKSQLTQYARHLLDSPPDGQSGKRNLGRVGTKK